ncbi:MAG: glycosyltransferase [Nanohaloarchaea archaeon]|nr:glycosyltransferase [Candidatus Nanohaloarchaea archaeon]
MRKKDKIIAVIPAYNEEKTIKKVIKETSKYVDEIIVVNDGSKDATLKEVSETNAITVSHIVNMGLGFTLATGCEAAIKRGASIIIHVDGDGQHSSTEIPKLVKALVDNGLDIVFGSRPQDKTMPFVKRLGNETIYQMSKFMFKIDVKDTQTGFRCFRANVYDKIKWKSSRYAVASEIVKNVGINKLKYKEVEVKTIYLDNYKGTTIIDGAKIGFDMILWRLGIC